MPKSDHSFSELGGISCFLSSAYDILFGQSYFMKCFLLHLKSMECSSIHMC